MAIERVSIRDNFVYRDSINTFRWYDAIGPHVVKYAMNTAAVPTDDTTGMPSEFTNTLVNASTFAHTDVLGGGVIFTAAGAENDGVSLQLGDELGGAGECVSFAGRYPTYFGIILQISDVDQTDFFAGFAVTDTALLGGVTDGIYFRSVDGSAVVNFVLEQDSAETANAVNTMTDATDVTLEFLYYGSNIYAYANGALMVTVADTDANFCNDELLRLSFEFLDGEAIGNTCTVKDWKFIQLQN
jgi:hypothetical protein